MDENIIIELIKHGIISNHRCDYSNEILPHGSYFVIQGNYVLPKYKDEATECFSEGRYLKYSQAVASNDFEDYDYYEGFEHIRDVFSSIAYNRYAECDNPELHKIIKEFLSNKHKLLGWDWVINYYNTLS